METGITMDAFLELCGVMALAGTALGILLPHAYPRQFDPLYKKSRDE